MDDNVKPPELEFKTDATRKELKMVMGTDFFLIPKYKGIKPIRELAIADVTKEINCG